MRKQIWPAVDSVQAQVVKWVTSRGREIQDGVVPQVKARKMSVAGARTPRDAGPSYEVCVPGRRDDDPPGVQPGCKRFARRKIPTKGVEFLVTRTATEIDSSMRSGLCAVK